MSQNLAPAILSAHPRARPSTKIQAIGIVIVARNNAGTISQCIASLYAANSHSGWRSSLWIVVVADRCTDDTAKVAREALGAFGQVLEVSAGSRQAAHGIGATAVVEHFCLVPRHTLLLTSVEASAELPRQWIDTQLECSQSPSLRP